MQIIYYIIANSFYLKKYAPIYLHLMNPTDCGTFSQTLS